MLCLLIYVNFYLHKKYFPNPYAIAFAQFFWNSGLTSLELSSGFINSGGLDIKPTSSMLTMKDDISGSACVLGVDEVIDIATLTGACVVALGSIATGVMGNDEEMIARVIKTAKESGETFWQLPMFKEFFNSLKSDVADMKNTGSRFGGASTAGVFLQEFVKDVKWTHIDIAGTAFLEKPQKEFIAGATGAGVRTLLNYVR